MNVVVDISPSQYVATVTVLEQAIVYVVKGASITELARRIMSIAASDELNVYIDRANSATLDVKLIGMGVTVTPLKVRSLDLRGGE